jgi:hypothetical protein
MLKVYLDLGAKRDLIDGVMCVAAVVFKPTPYKQFIRPWNRMLKAWNASAFHATDFYNGAGEFKRDTSNRRALFEEDARRIPKMIGEHIERILLVSFKPDEFNQKASPQWKAKFGTSVHSLAVQLCLVANGWWRHAKCPSQSFAYFMESGDQDEGEVADTIARMKNDTESGTGPIIRVGSFTRVDKGKARGLEAADFSAWQWNKYYMDKMRVGKEWNPRKDFAALISSSNQKIEYIFASGAYLDYFFSLVPREVLEGPTTKG